MSLILAMAFGGLGTVFGRLGAQRKAAASGGGGGGRAFAETDYVPTLAL